MQNPRSKYVNSRGVYYIKSLFIDLCSGVDKDACLYTLKSYDDQRGYPSLGRLYVEMGDLTEYEFANKYFANWEHWQIVSKSPSIQEHVERWRKELELKIRSRALRELIDIADPTTGSRNHYEANKFLVSGGWLTGEEKKEAAKRGRPSKASIKEKAISEFMEVTEQVENDLERLHKFTKARMPS